MIREAKMKYYTETFDKYKSDIKNTWKTINGILARSKGESKSFEEIVVNNKSISGKQEIANEFNNFFVHIGPKLAQCIDTNGKKPYSDYLNRATSNNFQWVFFEK